MENLTKYSHGQNHLFSICHLVNIFTFLNAVAFIAKKITVKEYANSGINHKLMLKEGFLSMYFYFT